MRYPGPQLRLLILLALTLLVGLGVREWRAGFPDAAERLLGRGSVDNLSDFGNLYGSGLTLAAATGGRSPYRFQRKLPPASSGSKTCVNPARA